MSDLPRGEPDGPKRATPVGRRWFWVGLAAGAPFIAVGVRSLLDASAVSAPISFAEWFLGSALAHDLVLAPLTLAAGLALRRVVPRGALGAVQAATALTVIVGLFALIPLAGWGRRAAEPTVQPLNYWLGFGILVAAIWGAAGAWMVLRRRHLR
jgi:hypothetical protein